VRRNIFASVDGGLSGGSRVRRPGNEDPPSALAEFISFISKNKSYFICELRLYVFF
jgi:hypothetical protein